MWLRADTMRRLWAGACGALLLAGCATTHVSHEPLTVTAQQALLQALPGFRFDGRAAVRAGEEGFNVPALSWQQAAGESRVQLSGPFGASALTLVFSPQSLRVTTSRGEELGGDEAASLLTEQLGFVPPFEALRYWVVGLAAPGEAPVDMRAGADGQVSQITQQGWLIRYDRRAGVATRAGQLRLPQKLTATRDDLRLTLFVDRWKLQVAD
jgi:outer membrane lipoprotein LolB